MNHRQTLAGTAALPVVALPLATIAAPVKCTDAAWPDYVERRGAFDALDADYRARASELPQEARHALGEAIEQAYDPLMDAEAAVHAAPTLTLADVRRKLEAAELHFEPDENDGVTINAAIDGLRHITGAARLT